jgi:hypothetical protein
MTIPGGPSQLPSSAEYADDVLSELRAVLLAAESAPSASTAGSADLDALFSALCDGKAHPLEPGADSTIDTMLGELLAESNHPEATFRA